MLRVYTNAESDQRTIETVSIDVEVGVVVYLLFTKRTALIKIQSLSHKT